MITRKEILDVYAHGSEAVIALVTAQAAEIAALTARIQALEDRVAKDSHNSHLPPSRDLPPKPKSLRRPSGKKPGGQPGHRGTTLAWSARPEQTVVYQPLACAGCGARLGGAVVVGEQRRQVVDLPPLRLATTEHLVERRQCTVCGQITQAAFPAEARGPVSYGPGLRGLLVYLNQYQLLPYARIASFVGDLFGCLVSAGTVVTAVAEADAALAETEGAIRQALQQKPVAHFDETGLRVVGTKQWAHVASTDRLTHYHVNARRGAAGMDAAGVLPGFGGVAVHDGLYSYGTFPCEHALCNAHHQRDLTFIAEQYKQAWAAELKTLLSTMRSTVDDARDAGQPQLAPGLRRQLTARYRQLVLAGVAANPAADKPPDRPGPPRRTKAGKLAERLGRYEGETLAFLHDFRIPFDNNQAERDLRMIKVQQKISGTFRTDRGANQFARIRGYLSTARKQGHSPFTAVQAVFTGQPLVLA